MIYHNELQIQGLVLVGSLVGIILALFYLQENRAQLPPSPQSRWPIVRNLRFLTALGKPRPWHLFHKWAQEYGPLIYLNLLGKPVIIINGAQVANDLLVHRASNYSGRPRNIVGCEYLCGGLIFPLLNGDIWRKMRRTSEAQFGSKSLLEFQNVQMDDGILFTYDMITRPEKREENILRVTASVNLSVIYGQLPLRSLDEPSVKLMRDFLCKMNEATQPGTHLVEIIPILEYLPTFLSPWKKRTKKDFQILSSKFLQEYWTVKEKMLVGEQKPSFCSTLLEAGSQHDLNDLESAWAGAVIYAAAYDSIVTTMSWFFLIMIHFPNVQVKAQGEIDKIVGQSRMPSFSDMNHLPYVCALIREILRWKPPSPIGLPHECAKDDYYDGQLIPGGSICISNIWSINRDPEVYGEDAEEFRPERHLDSNGKLRDETDEGHFAFGFGRRECIGRHYANKTLFINITMILWATSIEASANASGKIVIPNISEDVGDGIISQPPSFECLCTPRFEGVEATLKQARDTIFSAHGI